MHMMDHDQYTPETGNPDINSTYKSYEGKVFSISSNYTDHVTSNQFKIQKKQHLYFIDPHEEMVKMASYYAAITVGCMRILGKQYKNTYIYI